MDSLSLGIIELLKQDGNYTSEQIGKILSVSERTIRNRIKEINAEIILHGAIINAARGTGYHLEIINQAEFSAWMESLYDEKLNIPNSSEERIQYLIDFLLNQKDYVYIDDLSDLLYVARNTLSSDLKKLEQEVRKYSLYIERRPNHGIRIIGKEADKRSCIVDRIAHNNQYFINRLKTESLIMIFGDVLSTEFHSHKYKTSVDNYQIIKYIFYVTYSRAMNGFGIDFKEGEIQDVYNSVSEKILKMTDTIISCLGNDFSILNDEKEKLYIATQIAGRGNIDQVALDYVDNDVDLLISNMLNEVRDSLKIDFTGDFDMITSLRNHMIALDIRMRYHIPVENPILEMIKQKHSLAYALASYSCNYLSEHYNKVVSEDEIGFIAIIYELALQKKGSPIRKKNIVIICESGTSTSRFFVQKYKETFGEYLNEVYVCSAKEVESFDFAGKKIDYCFTTLNMDFDLPAPCYKVSIFPSDSEVNTYKNLLGATDKNELLKFYKQDLFIPHLSADNKQEALEKMVSYIKERYEIPDDFLDLILQREKFGLTSFGNMAATPHPIRLCTKQNIVCTGVLDHPIDWGNNDVELIILMSFADNEESDNREFVQSTADLISDDKAVEELIQERTFDKLIELLGR